jgi:hypothetical protein
MDSVARITKTESTTDIEDRPPFEIQASGAIKVSTTVTKAATLRLSGMT